MALKMPSALEADRALPHARPVAPKAERIETATKALAKTMASVDVKPEALKVTPAAQQVADMVGLPVEEMLEIVRRHLVRRGKRAAYMKVWRAKK